jgi:hypothetical protein
MAAVRGMPMRYQKAGHQSKHRPFASALVVIPNKSQGVRAQLRPMIKIDLLRAQHDEALAMADRLIDLADHHDPRSAAIPILMQLNRLLGLLRVHLAHEDVELYPTLTASRDALIARTAQRFVDEMGSLAGELECFARRWSCSVSIAGNIDEFREGIHQLVMTLAVRIERENRILYPLAEAETKPLPRRAA